MAEENQNEVQLGRLTKLIQSLSSERDLAGKVASRNVSESLSSRGIRGKFSSSRAADAARLATGGINRQITRLGNTRTDLEKEIEAQKNAVESVPTANARGRSLSQRLNAFNNQSQQLPPSIIRNLSGPESQSGQVASKFAVEVAGASNFQNFETLDQAIGFLRKRGLDKNALFSGPGNLSESNARGILDTLKRNNIRITDPATANKAQGRRAPAGLFTGVSRLAGFARNLSGVKLTEAQIRAKEALKGV